MQWAGRQAEETGNLMVEADGWEVGGGEETGNPVGMWIVSRWTEDAHQRERTGDKGGGWGDQADDQVNEVEKAEAEKSTEVVQAGVQRSNDGEGWPDAGKGGGGGAEEVVA